MAEPIKEVELEFKEIIKETSEIYSFVFEKPKGLEWKAGHHAIFRNLNCKEEGEKNYRIFSIASVPEENKVMFSTRITSESTTCKKKFLDLKKGDKIYMGNPQGKFLISDYEKPIFIIVGGIGITPVRAFLKDMDLKDINPKRLEVLYADDRGEFAYRETLEELDNKFDGLSIHLISDRGEFIEKIKENSQKMENQALYYISGTPGMNAIITEKLQEMGVGKDNIKTDNFIGY